MLGRVPMRNSSQVLQSTEATYESVRDGDGGGGGGGEEAQVPMCSLSKALRSAKKLEKTDCQHQNCRC